jgi:hypothetical protein
VAVAGSEVIPSRRREEGCGGVEGGGDSEDWGGGVAVAGSEVILSSSRRREEGWGGVEGGGDSEDGGGVSELGWWHFTSCTGKVKDYNGEEHEQYFGKTSYKELALA